MFVSVVASPIRSWSDAYLAIKRRLEELRGFIAIDADAVDALRWPRTSGQDVIFIAATLDRELREARPIGGSDGVHRLWRACLEDLERYAWRNAEGEYAENRTFWSCALAVCVHLDFAGQSPHDAVFWRAFFDELERGGEAGELRNLGPTGDGPFKHFDGVKTYDDLYIAQYKYLRDTRGADTMAQPPGDFGGGTFPVPRTTNGDVLLLAAYWSNAFADARAVLNDHDSVARKWQAVLADVDRLAKPGDPKAVYAKNNEFWRVMEDISTQVSVADEAPTGWDRLVAAFEHSVTHLPENIEKGVKYIAGGAKDVAVSAASAVGSAAGEAAKGLFSGFTTPLLVGGGLLGLFLLTRNRGEGAHGAGE